MISFNLNTSIHKSNPRAITTCWTAFKIHLKNHFHLSDFANINNKTILEEKIAKFTDAVSSAHSHASKPIKNTRHSYTPQHIKQIIALKNRARKMYQRTLNPTYKTEANRFQATLKKEIKIHNQNTWATKLASLEPQDNSLWQMQKLLRKKRSNIPNLNSSSGIASTDEQKANLIANAFTDNFTENKRPENYITNIDSDVTNTITSFFSTPPSTPTPPTNPVEISDYVRTLKNNKAPGSDNVTNKMIKNFPIKVLLILTYLINKILLLHHFPNNWKTAIVFPIHKEGKDKYLPDSYRPISLLSTLSKIAEHVILNRIHDHIYKSNFLNPNQYGFTKTLSTYHPLLRLTERISAGFQNGYTTGAVFLDIQKAFDRVWVDGLIFKLITNNFPPALIHILYSYLTDRRYRVRVNDTLSDTHHVNIGVTQGSLLGPVLFNIYVNDIPSHQAP
ncbi:probable RNA-directed DNA polymerase from transposon BS [Trichonephila clavipes]|nr:probable RNA-directed DNA polymerase from transposon BS [Trichonephila clavipes]